MSHLFRMKLVCMPEVFARLREDLVAELTLPAALRAQVAAVVRRVAVVHLIVRKESVEKYGRRNGSLITLA